jgi:hypothetical protein
MKAALLTQGSWGWLTPAVPLNLHAPAYRFSSRGSALLCAGPVSLAAGDIECVSHSCHGRSNNAVSLPACFCAIHSLSFTTLHVLCGIRTLVPRLFLSPLHLSSLSATLFCLILFCPFVLFYFGRYFVTVLTVISKCLWTIIVYIFPTITYLRKWVEHSFIIHRCAPQVQLPYSGSWSDSLPRSWWDFGSPTFQRCLLPP